MTNHLKGLLALYLAVFLLALNGLFAKLIPLDALSITQLRSLVAIGGFLVFARVSRKSLMLANKRDYVPIAFLGVLLGTHWVTFFHAMQVSTVAVGMLSLFSFPIITILLEPFFSRQRLLKSDLFAGLMVLAGIGIMVSQNLYDVQGGIAEGVFWGVLSALLFSLRNLIQKYRYSSVPSHSLMFYQVLAITIMLLPFLDTSQIGDMPAPHWGTVIALGIFSTATAHTLLTFSLKQLAAKSAALIGCLQPLIAAVLAAVVISEFPSVSVVCGGLLILGVSVIESTRK